MIEDVFMKDNENLMIVHIYVDDISDNMVDHFVQEMQSNLS